MQQPICNSRWCIDIHTYILHVHAYSLSYLVETRTDIFTNECLNFTSTEKWLNDQLVDWTDEMLGGYCYYKLTYGEPIRYITTTESCIVISFKKKQRKFQIFNKLEETTRNLWSIWNLCSFLKIHITPINNIFIFYFTLLFNN